MRIKWRIAQDARGVKKGFSDDSQMGPHTRFFLAWLHSSTFVSFLEKLSGIEGLVPDPHLNGSGFHSIERGGFLKIHADYNRHPQMGLDRRLNLLLYLNHKWEENYGGHLELWNKTMSDCIQKILPVFNRMVIFSTSDHSFHGHPDPLACPQDKRRQSLALYYYTKGRPKHECSEDHSTLYQLRPGEMYELS